MRSWIEGDRQLRNNNIIGAIATFSAGIRDEPHEIQNYYGRAKAYSLIGDFNGAVADLTQVIRIRPDVSYGYYRRAQICCNALEQYSPRSAVADYTRAIDLSPYDHQFYIHRTMAYAYTAQFDKAVVDIQEYLKLAERWYPVLTKAVPVFIVVFRKGQKQEWYQLWDQIKYEASPIDALVMQLWDDDGQKSEKAVEELARIGEPALPVLLVALEKDDRNSQMDDYENRLLRKAIVSIGKPAIMGLSNGLYTKTKLSRASAKTLRWFDDPLAEESLKIALESNDVRDHVKYYIRESLSMMENRKNSH